MNTDIVKSFLGPNRLARVEKVAAARTENLTVVLERIHNSHNISAVLRSADAFGIRDVHIIGDLDVSKGIALGAHHWLRISLHESSEKAAEALGSQGYELVVTAPEEDPLRMRAESDIAPVPVFQLPFQKKLALVFGNEKDGVSQTLASLAQHRAFIPMFGFVESLNISVACAIALFASTVTISSRERPVPCLGEEQRDALISEWLINNFSHPDALERELVRRAKKENE